MTTDKQSYKFSICRLIATAGVAFIMGYVLGEGGDFYLNLPSLVLPLAICFFMMLGAYGTDYLRFIPASLLALVCTPSTPNRRYAQMARSASRFVIGAGVAFGLMGVMMIMPSISSPPVLGMGLAVSMLTPFYAILVAELFFAVVYKAFSGPDPNRPGPGPLPMSNILIPVIVFGSAIGMFFILLNAYSSSWDEPPHRIPTAEIDYGTPQPPRYRINVFE